MNYWKFEADLALFSECPWFILCSIILASNCELLWIVLSIHVCDAFGLVYIFRKICFSVEIYFYCHIIAVWWTNSELYSSLLCKIFDCLTHVALLIIQHAGKFPNSVLFLTEGSHKSPHIVRYSMHCLLIVIYSHLPIFKFYTI